MPLFFLSPVLKRHLFSLWVFLCMIVFSMSAVLFECSGVFLDVCVCFISDRCPNEVACESPARTAVARGYPTSHPEEVRVQACFKFGWSEGIPGSTVVLLDDPGWRGSEPDGGHAPVLTRQLSLTPSPLDPDPPSARSLNPGQLTPRALLTSVQCLHNVCPISIRCSSRHNIKKFPSHWLHTYWLKQGHWHKSTTLYNILYNNIYHLVDAFIQIDVFIFTQQHNTITGMDNSSPLL